MSMSEANLWTVNSTVKGRSLGKLGTHTQVPHIHIHKCFSCWYYPQNFILIMSPWVKCMKACVSFNNVTNMNILQTILAILHLHGSEMEMFSRTIFVRSRGGTGYFDLSWQQQAWEYIYIWSIKIYHAQMKFNSFPMFVRLSLRSLAH